MTKYLHIRHWDYWWGVYGFTDGPVSEAEFSITDDRAGERFYFHLDVDTMPALKELLRSGEFMEKSDPSFPDFETRAAELERGSIDYFVGALYYEHYFPDMEGCNRYRQAGKDIFSVRSPERAPYYAVLFIREERQLLPELLIEWMKKLSPSLFCSHFSYEIADMPSREEAAEAYKEDMPAFVQQ